MRKTWNERAEALKRDTRVLIQALRDPRTPWYARAWAVAVVAYAVSPVDLVPDFIPVVGYLDDLIILPLGVFIALKMIPPEVLEDARARAAKPGRPWWGVAAAFIIILVWTGATWAGYLLLKDAFGGG